MVLGRFAVTRTRTVFENPQYGGVYLCLHVVGLAGLAQLFKGF